MVCLRQKHFPDVHKHHSRLPTAVPDKSFRKRGESSNIEKQNTKEQVEETSRGEDKESWIEEVR